MSKDKSENKKDKFIILGNGFNLALIDILSPSSNINIKLSYDEILKGIKDEIEEDSELYKFIKKNESEVSDVEWMLWILETSEFCLPKDNKFYCEIKDEQLELLRKDIKNLKKLFIDVVTSKNYHPEYSDIFCDNGKEKFEECKQNLNKFNRVFTINYDLILYWLMNHMDMLKNKKNSKDKKEEETLFLDGFSNTKEKKIGLNINNPQIENHIAPFSLGRNDTNLIYLHGAIHMLRRCNENSLEEAFKVVLGRLTHKEIKDKKEFIEKELFSDKYILIHKESDKWSFRWLPCKNGSPQLCDKFINSNITSKLKAKSVFQKLKKHIEEGDRNYTILKLENLKDILMQSSSEFDHLLVAQGGCGKKISEIFNNVYLSKSYEKLKNSKGKFVVYGCNIVGKGSNITSDNHLWRKIFNNAKELYLSFNNINLENERPKVIYKLNELRESKGVCRIILFNSREYNIWKSDFEKLYNDDDKENLKLSFNYPIE